MSEFTSQLFPECPLLTAEQRLTSRRLLIEMRTSIREQSDRILDLRLNAASIRTIAPSPLHELEEAIKLEEQAVNRLLSILEV